MNKWLRLGIVVLSLATPCLAQEGLTIHNKANAQGVVVFAFEDLMPVEQRLILAKRAVNWADATVEIERVEK
jgi:hypothetical protein